MLNIYWVGVRQSDIEDTGHFFKGSITIFGDNTNGNIAYCSKDYRINHNIDNEDCDMFFEKVLESLCDKDDSVRFIFYNPILSYRYSDLIQQHTLCLNPYDLLEILSSKHRVRYVLKDIIEMVPYTILNGSECSYNNIRKYFVGYDEFVIQNEMSSGGEGTFHIKSSSNLDYIDPNSSYLISPFIKNAISLNTHIIIFEDDIMYFPSSVQIITEMENKLLYSGADYICYKSIPSETRSYINKKIHQIAKFIQQKGYRGVIGIDFILKDKQLYFMEFNARFQASTQLINKALYAQNNLSLQEINLQAFDCINAPKVKPFDVEYSNFVYSTSNISHSRLKRIATSKEVYQIQRDGYNEYDTYPDEKNIYLNRYVFNRNICSINGDKLVLHPNIYFEDVKAYLRSDHSHYKEYIKLSLLNHGVDISESAKKLSQKHGIIKQAVFDAIDAIIFDKVYVNIPYNCKFNSLSPFTVETSGDKFILLCDGIFVSDIDIYYVPNSLINKQTSSGVPYDAIINLATDRIRINPAPVCYYKRRGIPCKFCNLPDSNINYTVSDIKEVIDYCLDNVEFEHFLIGGGSYSIDSKAWIVIEEIAQYIRNRCEKNIYLMSLPPEKKEVLDALKESGITEVAFNLEIFDRNMAREYMPGKGTISIDQYLAALTYAVSLWGDTGCVRSLLIYGFDTDENFLCGIDHLCKLGIEPIVSIFRPLSGTEFENLNPPSTIDVLTIYNESKRIVDKYSLILGPDCPLCQNNTLSFTEVK